LCFPLERDGKIKHSIGNNNIFAKKKIKFI
jgi:hypothetical protein